MQQQLNLKYLSPRPLLIIETFPRIARLAEKRFHIAGFSIHSASQYLPSLAIWANINQVITIIDLPPNDMSLQTSRWSSSIFNTYCDAHTPIIFLALSKEVHTIHLLDATRDSILEKPLNLCHVVDTAQQKVALFQSKLKNQVTAPLYEKFTPMLPTSRNVRHFHQLFVD